MIRHFVITRFLCCDFGYGEKIKSPEFIAEGIRLLRTFFVPSLMNQSNHNFEVIFAIHDEIPDERVNELKAIEMGDIKTHIVRWSDIDSFIYYGTSLNDIVITSRMDYDDLIHREAAEIIQNLALNTTDVEYLWHGYSTGCTLIEGDEKHELHKMVKKYNGDGAWSTFQSLILFGKHKTTIYGLGDHTKIKYTVKSGNFCLPYSSGNFLTDDRGMAYVWVRHRNTGSHSCQHDTEQVIPITDNEFKSRFGFSLHET